MRHATLPSFGFVFLGPGQPRASLLHLLASSNGTWQLCRGDDRRQAGGEGRDGHGARRGGEPGGWKQPIGKRESAIWTLIKTLCDIFEIGTWIDPLFPSVSNLEELSFGFANSQGKSWDIFHKGVSQTSDIIIHSYNVPNVASLNILTKIELALFVMLKRVATCPSLSVKTLSALPVA